MAALPPPRIEDRFGTPPVDPIAPAGWLRRRWWLGVWAVVALTTVIGLASLGQADSPSETGQILTANEVATTSPATTFVTATTTTTTTVPVTTSTAAPTSAPAPASTATPTPADGGARASDALATIAVAKEAQAGYNRALFPSDGADINGSCPTREVVLRRDSTTPVVADGCHVTAGTWVSSYDGATVTDPNLVEIDHVVSLKEAWDSGANGWTTAQRQAYANDLSDPRTLRVVTTSANGSKGDRDPSNWLPTVDSCRYLGDWIAIKVRWGLTMDESEAGRVRNVLAARCPDLVIAPTVPVPALPADAPGTPAAPSANQPEDTGSIAVNPIASIPPESAHPPAAPQAPPPSPGVDVRYRTCKEAKAHGLGPYYKGADPEYYWYRDADHDGIDCE